MKKSVDQTAEKQPITSQRPFPMPSSIIGSSSTWKTRDVAKKDNPDAKPAPLKCYRCLELGHKLSKCPNRRPASLADCEGDKDVIDDDRLQDADYVERDCVSCVIRKLLCTPKV